MKNKVTETVLIPVPIMATILSAILNFKEFLMGGNATTKNIVVTTVYIAIWFLVTAIGIINKQRSIIKYCSIFWGMTLFLILLILLLNTTGIDAGIVDLFIPFAILLLGPWFGIQQFAESLQKCEILITLIPVVMFLATFVSLKRLKQV
ncbi:hypothetical protein HMPREF1982_03433 [Clostridiales bacterium oral taxon 876 str. F0540]|nr:hypothetical protein HMPREF1982_03433 [Clostridiales bacterium oral taxon 876 str. F0540]